MRSGFIFIHSELLFRVILVELDYFFYPTVEIIQPVGCVRRVDRVDSEAETYEQRLDAENALESADDRDTAARVERYRFLAERVFQRFRCRRISRLVSLEYVRLAPVQVFHVHLYALGRDLAEMRLEEFRYFLEVLIRH